MGKFGCFDVDVVTLCNQKPYRARVRGALRGCARHIRLHVRAYSKSPITAPGRCLEWTGKFFGRASGHVGSSVRSVLSVCSFGFLLGVDYAYVI